ncbi:hypothetical protein VTN00DRAFT_6441 [Thermoascus crustaceus]|uniref:uncharacterized protein n=1 Tax=Thermoascus crustaceus TaxID=5088 RepID=UPI003742FD4B
MTPAGIDWHHSVTWKLNAFYSPTGLLPQVTEIKNQDQKRYGRLGWGKMQESSTTDLLTRYCSSSGILDGNTDNTIPHLHPLLRPRSLTSLQLIPVSNAPTFSGTFCYGTTAASTQTWTSSRPPYQILWSPISAVHQRVTIQQQRNNNNNISLILGIEIDEPYASPRLMRDWHWSRCYGFIQYTMYAPRRFRPVLRKTIVQVLSHTRAHNRKNLLFSRWRYDEKTILEVTDPGVFTDAVLDVLSESLPSNHDLIKKSIDADQGVGDLAVVSDDNAHINDNNDNKETMRKRVTWAPFHRLQTPIWVDSSESEEEDMGGLGVLPVNVWGNGQRHSGSEHFGSAQACINHRFGRTWKKGWWEYLFG